MFYANIDTKYISSTSNISFNFLFSVFIFFLFLLLFYFLTFRFHVTPQTIFLNDFFSWNLSFRCFMVHHEFIILLGIISQLNGMLGKYIQ